MGKLMRGLIKGGRYRRGENIEVVYEVVRDQKYVWAIEYQLSLIHI